MIQTGLKHLNDVAQCLAEVDGQLVQLQKADADVARVATLPGVEGFFAHLGFSPDGNTLFAASLEGTTLLWRAPSWEEIEAKEKRERAP